MSKEGKRIYPEGHWSPVQVIVTNPVGIETTYKSQSAAARSLGVSVGNISDCIRGARRSILKHTVRKA